MSRAAAFSLFLTFALAFRTYFYRGSYAPSSASKRAQHFLLYLPLIYWRRDGIVGIQFHHHWSAQRIPRHASRGAPLARKGMREREWITMQLWMLRKRYAVDCCCCYYYWWLRTRRCHTEASKGSWESVSHVVSQRASATIFDSLRWWRVNEKLKSLGTNFRVIYNLKCKFEM